ncbi:MAG: hypothetical protein R3321_08310, partial [Nitrososphaeraceae archaeon]|nr:hypothetical protein [Nitrososphaeraceae archaeon]
HKIDSGTFHNYLRPGYNIIFKPGSKWFNKVNVGDKLDLYNGSVLLAGSCPVDAVVTIPFWKIRETELRLNHKGLSRDDLKNDLMKGCDDNKSQLIVTMILTCV